jgi:hypothetical protein
MALLAYHAGVRWQAKRRKIIRKSRLKQTQAGSGTMIDDRRQHGFTGISPWNRKIDRRMIVTHPSTDRFKR